MSKSAGGQRSPLFYLCTVLFLFLYFLFKAPLPLSVDALNHISEIIENSILLDTTVSGNSSKSKMKNTAFMHSFYTVYHGSLLKLYVEEALSNNEKEVFTRAYELKDIQKIADIPNGVLQNKLGLTEETSATIDTISDLYTIVKLYDKDFKGGKEIYKNLLNKNDMLTA